MYKANDGMADSDMATVTITVNAVNDAPVAANDSYSTDEDTVQTVAAPGVLGNDTDVDGNPLTTLLVMEPAHGVLRLHANGSFTYTPNANFNGVDSFIYKANDSVADSALATVTLIVNAVNDAPISSNDSYSTNEDTVLTVAAPGVLSNDTDIDGNPLTAILVAGPSNGTLTLNAEGSFTYTPHRDFNGLDSFTYKANDGAADSASATVTITVQAVNDTPNAMHDVATTAEDTAVTISVLANDTDVDGDTLTVMSVTPGNNGTVVINAGTTVTYTPNANFHGTDTFSYTLSDGQGGTATATVTVTVTPVNDIPVARDDSHSIDEDTTLTVAAPGVLGNDTDVDRDALTAVLVMEPSNGTLTLNADGSFTYRPQANFNGSDRFTYKANDGVADAPVATVTITVNAVNDVPIANNQNVTTPEDTPVVITLTGFDIEGSALSFTVTVPPSHGTLGALVPDTMTAMLTYMPAPNFNGVDSFLFMVNDGTDDSPQATITLEITSINDGPMANNQSVTTNEDVAVRITLTGSDPEGDLLTFTIVTGPAHGTLSGTLPEITYTPAPNFNGTDSFTFTVSDGREHPPLSDTPRPGCARGVRARQGVPDQGLGRRSATTRGLDFDAEVESIGYGRREDILCTCPDGSEHGHRPACR